jgi:hypothetical protein
MKLSETLNVPVEIKVNASPKSLIVLSLAVVGGVVVGTRIGASLRAIRGKR